MKRRHQLILRTTARWGNTFGCAAHTGSARRALDYLIDLGIFVTVVSRMTIEATDA
jgi:hypothetical protein